MRQERNHGELTGLVCQDAHDRARQDLDEARHRYTQAALALTIAREKLEPVVEQAFAQQSFSPIEALFCEEEVALKVYDAAVAQLAEAEGRYFSLNAALASERELALAGPLPRQRLH